VDINSLKESAPTIEEWRSMRLGMEMLRHGEERLLIGYFCMAVSLQVSEIMGKEESAQEDASPRTTCKHEFLDAAKTRSLAD